MPYASVDELPAAVRTKLKGKPKKLRQWMHVWNGEYDAHHDESRAFASAWSAVQKMAIGVDMMDGEVNFFLPIAKIDKQARTISGYASTSCIDSDGEVVSQEALKAALPDYMRWANIREMHRPSAVGVAQEANLDSRGLYLTAKIADDTAWQKILDGVYKGFSVGGRKLAKVGNTITKLSLVEISVVDRPANPECSFAVNKAASADAPAYLVPESESEGSITPLPQNADNLDEDSKPEQEPDNDQDDAAEVAAAIAEGREAIDSRTKKILKREFSAGQRKRLASSGAALSDGSFPIANESDLKNAIRAIGRASDPTTAKAHIRSRAKALGLTSLIPGDWASAKKLAKKLTKRNSASTSPSSAHDVDGGAEAALSKVECSHELDLRGSVSPMALVLQEGDTLRGASGLRKSKRKVKVMSETNGGSADLNKLLSVLTKGGGAPRVDPTVTLLKAADEDMKSSRDKRKDAEDDCEKLFALHKAAHEQQQALVKSGGKLKDGNAFDHVGAMKFVKSIYDNLRGVRALTKTARLNLAKAADRVGGEGVVENGVSGVYEVPSGLRTISPGEMDNLPANKLAKGAAGAEFVSKSESDALVRAARAEAESALLKSMPATPSGGQRPVTFDLTKFGGPANVSSDNPLMKDINPADLVSQDQSTRESAVSKLIGNRVLAGQGQTIFSPTFHGTAGGAA